MYHNLFRTAIVLLLISLSTMPLAAQSMRIQPSCPMHIVIAVDFSGSERAYLGEIRTALEALTSTFELHETNLKIGIVTFNRGARAVLPLTSDTQKLDEAIEALHLPRIVYATDIHAAIEEADQQFRKNSVTGIPKFFVLISDGDPHAHSRGYGFQADLKNIKQLKAGDPEAKVDPVHVFSLYTGRLSPYQNHFSEAIRKAAIHHMQALASDWRSFFFYEEYPMLVDFFIGISNCP